MTFAHPSFGLLFLVLCIIALGSIVPIRNKMTTQAQTWGVLLRTHISLQGKLQSVLRHCCLMIGLVAFGIALARPQWGYRLEKRQQNGLNIIFALDTSKSMLASDVRPNRLELAKISIQELLKSLAGNQVGLIAFAGDAFLQCPSTADYGAFKLSLQALNTNIIAKGGTNLSAAMELALTLFDSVCRYKQIILLTDGENLSGNAIVTAQKLKDLGIVVHTVGIGSTQGSPIGIRNERGILEYLKDDQGQTIFTKLDEATLKQIAQITHGFYVPMGNMGEGLQTIYQTVLKNLPKETFESLEKIPQERYAWFAGLALLLLGIEPLIYSFRKQRK